MKPAELMVSAFSAATHSPDPSTQNGAVLVTPDGELLYATLACNEFPVGVKYSDERWERPAKYSFIEHAERNAIYRAAREGIATQGLVMYVVWATCDNCARAIIQAGLSKVVTLPPETDCGAQARWDDSIRVGLEMLEESRVEVEFFNEPIPQVPLLRRNGELWWPKALA